VQKRSDQHSIRFEHFNGVTVIAISGNYYGAYSSDKFNDEQRARQTFLDVVVPILKAAVPVFQANASVQGYAVEVSHHVIGRTMGMPIERAENLMVFLPQAAAIKLVAAQSNLAQQGALLDANVLLNGKQLEIWLTDEEQAAAKEPAPIEAQTASTPPAATIATASVPAQTLAANGAPGKPDPKPAPAPPQAAPAPPPPAHDASPQTLAALQSSIQGASNHMLKELDPEAHFVTYAPPAFIPSIIRSILNFRCPQPCLSRPAPPATSSLRWHLTSTFHRSFVASSPIFLANRTLTESASAPRCMDASNRVFPRQGSVSRILLSPGIAALL